jgi:hypothetical protein
LALLLAVQIGLTVTVAQHRLHLGVLIAALVLAGVGIALVQTPAATGATRSPAGAEGTGLGLFNLVRFGGSACGAAWVAVALAGPASYPGVFIACAVIVALGLAGSFFGPDPA